MTEMAHFYLTEHMCNACPKLRQAGCGHRRWVYRAGRAAAESARRRSESRQGIDMEPEAAGRALVAVGDGIGRGMSPYGAPRGMPPDVRVSPSTIYDWVERGYVSCNLALQRKVKFKPVCGQLSSGNLGTKFFPVWAWGARPPGVA